MRSASIRYYLIKVGELESLNEELQKRETSGKVQCSKFLFLCFPVSFPCFRETRKQGNIIFDFQRETGKQLLLKMGKQGNCFPVSLLLFFPINTRKMVLERLFWVGVENNSVFHARPTELSRAFLIIRVRNRLGEFASKARLG